MSPAHGNDRTKSWIGLLSATIAGLRQTGGRGTSQLEIRQFPVTSAILRQSIS